VDDAPDILIAQPITDRGGLRTPEGAQVEAVEVAIEQLVRVFDVGVADQVDACLRGQNLEQVVKQVARRQLR
jgi:hypothetical protein